MYGSNNYGESLSKSQAGIPKNVKFGPYIFPIFELRTVGEGNCPGPVMGLSGGKSPWRVSKQ